MKRRLRLLFLYLLAALGQAFGIYPRGPARHILYIKPDHLGDLLLATPALAALRAGFPAARITALVGPWSRMVLARNPDVDLLLTCPFPGFERAPATAGHGPRTLLRPYLLLAQYALLLRAERYDLAIIGRDDHWWGAALALLAGVPLRVGFAVPECRPFLTIALPWDPQAHVTRQGLQLVAAVIQSPHPAHTYPARFDPAPADIAWAEEWLLSQGIDSHDRLVVIHPGTGGPAKLWFGNRWAQIGAALTSSGTRVLVTGGPGEEPLVEEVIAGMPVRPLALAGRTSVGQLAALLRRADLVAGVDSGPLHLAAAQGTTTLHLYGPGDSGRFGPWGDPQRHSVLRSGIWCSPCGVFSACPRGLAQPECMSAIEVAEVLAAAQQAGT